MYNLGGDEVKAYFIIVQQNFAHNLGLLDIPGFTILIPHIGINAPVICNHGKLGPCPRPWRRIGAAHRITAVCLFRARCERPTIMA